jgi:hypothetical protein
VKRPVSCELPPGDIVLGFAVKLVIAGAATIVDFPFELAIVPAGLITTTPSSACKPAAPGVKETVLLFADPFIVAFVADHAKVVPAACVGTEAE